MCPWMVTSVGRLARGWARPRSITEARGAPLTKEALRSARAASIAARYGSVSIGTLREEGGLPERANIHYERGITLLATMLALPSAWFD